jgi:hypothetical protein
MNNDIFYPWFAREATRMKWIWTEYRMFGLLRLGLDLVHNTCTSNYYYFFLISVKLFFSSYNLEQREYFYNYQNINANKYL